MIPCTGIPTCEEKLMLSSKIIKTVWFKSLKFLPIFTRLFSDFSPSIFLVSPKPENFIFSTSLKLISLFSRLKSMVSFTPESNKKVRSTPLIFNGMKIKLLMS